MSLNQKALNAEAKINGIDIVSASNTLANVADGLTVKLLKTTTSAVDVSVTQDTDAVKTAINGFVSAYNDLNGFIRTQTKYNPDSKVAGTLQGDRTAVGLQNQLRSVLRDSSTASALYTRFSDVGTIPMILSAAEFGAFVAAEAEKWTKVVKFAGIKPE